MRQFVKGRLYKCTHNLVGNEWFGNCHFTKGNSYKAFDSFGIKDDNGSQVEFPITFNVGKYFIEDDEAF